MAEPGSGEYGGMSEAQRNAIVEALLAQAQQQQSAPPSYMYGDSAPSDPYAYPGDPADPDTGYATLGDLGLSSPVAASPGDMSSPTAAGLAAINANAANNPDASSQNTGAPMGSPSASLSAAMAAPVGTPAGYYAGLPGFTSPDNDVAAAPAPSQQAQNALGDMLGLNDITGPVAQGLTLGGRDITGYNMAPAFNAFEGAYEGSPQAAPAPGYPATSEQFGPPDPGTPAPTAQATPAVSQAITGALAGPGAGPTGAPGMGDVSGGYTTGYGSDQVGYGGDIAGGPGTGFGTGTGPGFGGFGDPGGFGMSGLSSPGSPGDISGGFTSSDAGLSTSDAAAGFSSGFDAGVAAGFDAGAGFSGDAGGFSGDSSAGGFSGDSSASGFSGDSGPGGSGTSGAGGGDGGGGGSK